MDTQLRTLGQVGYEAAGRQGWEEQHANTKAEYERASAAIVAEHNRRAGTDKMVELFQRAIRCGNWESFSQTEKELIRETMAAIRTWKAAQ